MTASEISKALNNKYIGNSKYRVPNAYIFRYDWESDFFVLKQNNYSYEFEIKVSRQDFFADKKKVDKHLILDTGTFEQYGSKYEKGEKVKFTKTLNHSFRPNKFFYVVPENLIALNEIPKYAGLIYALPYEENDWNSPPLKTVKEAPFIHKETFGDKYEVILCKKFFNYWKETEYNLRRCQIDLKECINNKL